MERRKFIRGAGLVGGLLGGVLAGREVIERIHTKETIVKQILPPVQDVASSKDQPVGNVHLTLQGSSKLDKEPISAEGTLFINYPKVYDRKVDLAVGVDNRLWMRVDNVWHRVSVDPLNHDA